MNIGGRIEKLERTLGLCVGQEPFFVVIGPEASDADAAIERVLSDAGRTREGCAPLYIMDIRGAAR